MKELIYDLINHNDEKKVVLYTPEYEWIKTPQSNKREIILVYKNDAFYVEKIQNCGENKIPLHGVVLSYPKNVKIELTVEEPVQIKQYQYYPFANALINEKGKRCAIHKYNQKYYENEIALFDRKYSVFTLVYQNYYEMILKLDPQVRGWIVSSLQHKQKDKMLGREIDKGSYVLLCNDTNDAFFQRFELNEEIFFEIPLVVENKEITFNYTEYNPKPLGKVNFDATFFAFRAADTCMIYDINGYTVDKKTRLTGTNVWGYEIAVDENGTIVDANINVKVPINGYVISGVSEFYPILKNEFKLGGKVTLNKSKKLVTLKINYMVSCLYQYQVLFKEVQDILQRVKQLYDLDAELIYKYVDKFLPLKEKMENRKMMIEYSQGHEREYHLQRFDQYFNKALDYYHQIHKLGIEPSRVEVRACWHEPHEKTLQEVCETLDTLKASNFNELIVGGVMNGGVIFKSNKYALNDFVKGWFGDEYQDDYLLCLTKEAKKRNIKIQISSDNFFAVAYLLKQDYEKYSKWLAKDYYGQIGQRHYGEITLFFDPVNPQAQDLILDIYKEMLDHYEIAGLQLDYIRYCIGNDQYLTAYGYNEDTVEKFKKEYHYQGDIHELVKDAKIYEDFCEFRRNELTKFVKRVRALLGQYHNVQLTIAVVSEHEIAKSSKLQDWPTWANLDLIDGIYLMAYHLGEDPVYHDCIQAKELVKDHAFVYGGVAPIYNQSNINLVLKQVEATKKAKVDGFSLFAFHSFQNRPDLYYYFNNNGPYKNAAIPTYEVKEVVMKNVIDELNDRYQRIYKNQGRISENEFQQFILQLKNAKTIEDIDQIEYIAHPNVRMHLEEVKEKMKRYFAVMARKNRL